MRLDEKDVKGKPRGRKTSPSGGDGKFGCKREEL